MFSKHLHTEMQWKRRTVFFRVFNSLPFVNVSLLKEKEQSWGHSLVFARLFWLYEAWRQELSLPTKHFFFLLETV